MGAFYLFVLLNLFGLILSLMPANTVGPCNTRQTMKHFSGRALRVTSYHQLLTRNEIMRLVLLISLVIKSSQELDCGMLLECMRVTSIRSSSQAQAAS